MAYQEPLPKGSGFTKSRIFITLSEYSVATLAQLVEHIFRKDGVPSSSLGGGSR